MQTIKSERVAPGVWRHIVDVGGRKFEIEAPSPALDQATAKRLEDQIRNSYGLKTPPPPDDLIDFSKGHKMAEQIWPWLTGQLRLDQLAHPLKPDPKRPGIYTGTIDLYGKPYRVESKKPSMTYGEYAKVRASLQDPNFVDWDAQLKKLDPKRLAQIRSTDTRKLVEQAVRKTVYSQIPKEALAIRENRLKAEDAISKTIAEVSKIFQTAPKLAGKTATMDIDRQDEGILAKDYVKKIQAVGSQIAAIDSLKRAGIATPELMAKRALLHRQLKTMQQNYGRILEVRGDAVAKAQLERWDPVQDATVLGMQVGQLGQMGATLAMMTGIPQGLAGAGWGIRNPRQALYEQEMSHRAYRESLDPKDRWKYDAVMTAARVADPLASIVATGGLAAAGAAGRLGAAGSFMSKILNPAVIENPLAKYGAIALRETAIGLGALGVNALKSGNQAYELAIKTGASPEDASKAANAATLRSLNILDPWFDPEATVDRKVESAMAAAMMAFGAYHGVRNFEPVMRARVLRHIPELRGEPFRNLSRDEIVLLDQMLRLHAEVLPFWGVAPEEAVRGASEVARNLRRMAAEKPQEFRQLLRDAVSGQLGERIPRFLMGTEQLRRKADMPYVEAGEPRRAAPHGPAEEGPTTLDDPEIQGAADAAAEVGARMSAHSLEQAPPEPEARDGYSPRAVAGEEGERIEHYRGRFHKLTAEQANRVDEIELETQVRLREALNDRERARIAKDRQKALDEVFSKAEKLPEDYRNTWFDTLSAAVPGMRIHVSGPDVAVAFTGAGDPFGVTFRSRIPLDIEQAVREHGQLTAAQVARGAAAATFGPREDDDGWGIEVGGVRVPVKAAIALATGENAARYADIAHELVHVAERMGILPNGTVKTLAKLAHVGEQLSTASYDELNRRGWGPLRQRLEAVADEDLTQEDYAKAYNFLTKTIGSAKYGAYKSDGPLARFGRFLMDMAKWAVLSAMKRGWVPKAEMLARRAMEQTRREMRTGRLWTQAREGEEPVQRVHGVEYSAGEEPADALVRRAEEIRAASPDHPFVEAARILAGKVHPGGVLPDGRRLITEEDRKIPDLDEELTTMLRVVQDPDVLSALSDMAEEFGAFDHRKFDTPGLRMAYLAAHVPSAVASAKYVDKLGWLFYEGTPPGYYRDRYEEWSANKLSVMAEVYPKIFDDSLVAVPGLEDLKRRLLDLHPVAQPHETFFRVVNVSRPFVTFHSTSSDVGFQVFDMKPGEYRGTERTPDVEVHSGPLASALARRFYASRESRFALLPMVLPPGRYLYYSSDLGSLVGAALVPFAENNLKDAVRTRDAIKQAVDAGKLDQKSLRRAELAVEKAKKVLDEIRQLPDHGVTDPSQTGVAFLKRLGFDGVIYRNIVENPMMLAEQIDRGLREAQDFDYLGVPKEVYDFGVRVTKKLQQARKAFTEFEKRHPEETPKTFSFISLSIGDVKSLLGAKKFDRSDPRIDYSMGEEDVRSLAEDLAGMLEKEQPDKKQVFAKLASLLDERNLADQFLRFRSKAEKPSDVRTVMGDLDQTHRFVASRDGREADQRLTTLLLFLKTPEGMEWAKRFKQAMGDASVESIEDPKLRLLYLVGAHPELMAQVAYVGPRGWLAVCSKPYDMSQLTEELRKRGIGYDTYGGTSDPLAEVIARAEVYQRLRLAVAGESGARIEGLPRAFWVNPPENKMTVLETRRPLLVFHGTKSTVPFDRFNTKPADYQYGRSRYIESHFGSVGPASFFAAAFAVRHPLSNRMWARAYILPTSLPAGRYLYAGYDFGTLNAGNLERGFAKNVARATRLEAKVAKIANDPNVPQERKQRLLQAAAELRARAKAREQDLSNAIYGAPSLSNAAGKWLHANGFKGIVYRNGVENVMSAVSALTYTGMFPARLLHALPDAISEGWPQYRELVDAFHTFRQIDSIANTLPYVGSNAVIKTKQASVISIRPEYPKSFLASEKFDRKNPRIDYSLGDEDLVQMARELATKLDERFPDKRGAFSKVAELLEDANLQAAYRRFLDGASRPIDVPTVMGDLDQTHRFVASVQGHVADQRLTTLLLFLKTNEGMRLARAFHDAWGNWSIEDISDKKLRLLYLVGAYPELMAQVAYIDPRGWLAICSRPIPPIGWTTELPFLGVNEPPSVPPREHYNIQMAFDEIKHRRLLAIAGDNANKMEGVPRTFWYFPPKDKAFALEITRPILAFHGTTVKTGFDRFATKPKDFVGGDTEFIESHFGTVGASMIFAHAREDGDRQTGEAWAKALILPTTMPAGRYYYSGHDFGSLSPRHLEQGVENNLKRAEALAQKIEQRAQNPDLPDRKKLELLRLAERVRRKARLVGEEVQRSIQEHSGVSGGVAQWLADNGFTGVLYRNRYEFTERALTLIPDSFDYDIEVIEALRTAMQEGWPQAQEIAKEAEAIAKLRNMVYELKSEGGYSAFEGYKKFESPSVIAFRPEYPKSFLGSESFDRSKPRIDYSLGEDYDSIRKENEEYQKNPVKPLYSATGSVYRAMHGESVFGAYANKDSKHYRTRVAYDIYRSIVGDQFRFNTRNARKGLLSKIRSIVRKALAGEEWLSDVAKLANKLGEECAAHIAIAVGELLSPNPRIKPNIAKGLTLTVSKDTMAKIAGDELTMKLDPEQHALAVAEAKEYAETTGKLKIQKEGRFYVVTGTPSAFYTASRKFSKSKKRYRKKHHWNGLMDLATHAMVKAIMEASGLDLASRVIDSAYPITLDEAMDLWEEAEGKPIDWGILGEVRKTFGGKVRVLLPGMAILSVEAGDFYVSPGPGPAKMVYIWHVERRFHWIGGYRAKQQRDGISISDAHMLEESSVEFSDETKALLRRDSGNLDAPYYQSRQDSMYSVVSTSLENMLVPEDAEEMAVDTVANAPLLAPFFKDHDRYIGGRRAWEPYDVPDTVHVEATSDDELKALRNLGQAIGLGVRAVGEYTDEDGKARHIVEISGIAQWASRPLGKSLGDAMVLIAHAFGRHHALNALLESLDAHGATTGGMSVEEATDKATRYAERKALELDRMTALTSALSSLLSKIIEVASPSTFNAPTDEKAAIDLLAFLKAGPIVRIMNGEPVEDVLWSLLGSKSADVDTQAWVLEGLRTLADRIEHAALVGMAEVYKKERVQGHVPNAYRLHFRYQANAQNYERRFGHTTADPSEKEAWKLPVTGWPLPPELPTDEQLEAARAIARGEAPGPIASQQQPPAEDATQSEAPQEQATTQEKAVEPTETAPAEVAPDTASNAEPPEPPKPPKSTASGDDEDEGPIPASELLRIIAQRLDIAGKPLPLPESFDKWLTKFMIPFHRTDEGVVIDSPDDFAGRFGWVVGAEAQQGGEQWSEEAYGNDDILDLSRLSLLFDLLLQAVDTASKIEGDKDARNAFAFLMALDALDAAAAQRKRSDTFADPLAYTVSNEHAISSATSDMPPDSLSGLKGELESVKNVRLRLDAVEPDEAVALAWVCHACGIPHTIGRDKDGFYIEFPSLWNLLVDGSIALRPAAAVFYTLYEWLKPLSDKWDELRWGASWQDVEALFGARNNAMLELLKKAKKPLGLLFEGKTKNRIEVYKGNKIHTTETLSVGEWLDRIYALPRDLMRRALSETRLSEIWKSMLQRLEAKLRERYPQGIPDHVRIAPQVTNRIDKVDEDRLYTEDYVLQWFPLLYFQLLDTHSDEYRWVRIGVEPLAKFKIPLAFMGAHRNILLSGYGRIGKFRAFYEWLFGLRNMLRDSPLDGPEWEIAAFVHIASHLSSHPSKRPLSLFEFPRTTPKDARAEGLKNLSFEEVRSVERPHAEALRKLRKKLVRVTLYGDGRKRTSHYIMAATYLGVVGGLPMEIGWNPQTKAIYVEFKDPHAIFSDAGENAVRNAQRLAKDIVDEAASNPTRETLREAIEAIGIIATTVEAISDLQGQAMRQASSMASEDWYAYNDEGPSFAEGKGSPEPLRNAQRALQKALEAVENGESPLRHINEARVELGDVSVPKGEPDLEDMGLAGRDERRRQSSKTGAAKGKKKAEAETAPEQPSAEQRQQGTEAPRPQEPEPPRAQTSEPPAKRTPEPPKAQTPEPPRAQTPEPPRTQEPPATLPALPAGPKALPFLEWRRKVGYADNKTRLVAEDEEVPKLRKEVDQSIRNRRLPVPAARLMDTVRELVRRTIGESIVDIHPFNKNDYYGAVMRLFVYNGLAIWRGGDKYERVDGLFVLSPLLDKGFWGDWEKRDDRSFIFTVWGVADVRNAFGIGRSIATKLRELREKILKSKEQFFRKAAESAGQDYEALEKDILEILDFAMAFEQLAFAAMDPRGNPTDPRLGFFSWLAPDFYSFSPRGFVSDQLKKVREDALRLLKGKKLTDEARLQWARKHPYIAAVVLGLPIDLVRQGKRHVLELSDAGVALQPMGLRIALALYPLEVAIQELEAKAQLKAAQEMRQIASEFRDAVRQILYGARWAALDELARLEPHAPYALMINYVIDEMAHEDMAAFEHPGAYLRANAPDLYAEVRRRLGLKDEQPPAPRQEPSQPEPEREPPAPARQEPQAPPAQEPPAQPTQQPPARPEQKTRKTRKGASQQTPAPTEEGGTKKRGAGESKRNAGSATPTSGGNLRGASRPEPDETVTSEQAPPTQESGGGRTPPPEPPQAPPPPPPDEPGGERPGGEGGPEQGRPRSEQDRIRDEVDQFVQEIADEVADRMESAPPSEWGEIRTWIYSKARERLSAETLQRGGVVGAAMREGLVRLYRRMVAGGAGDLEAVRRLLSYISRLDAMEYDVTDVQRRIQGLQDRRFGDDLETPSVPSRESMGDAIDRFIRGVGMDFDPNAPPPQVQELLNLARQFVTEFESKITDVDGAEITMGSLDMRPLDRLTAAKILALIRILQYKRGEAEWILNDIENRIKNGEQVTGAEHEQAIRAVEVLQHQIDELIKTLEYDGRILGTGLQSRQIRFFMQADFLPAELIGRLVEDQREREGEHLQADERGFFRYAGLMESLLGGIRNADELIDMLQALSILTDRGVGTRPLTEEEISAILDEVRRRRAQERQERRQRARERAQRREGQQPGEGRTPQGGAQDGQAPEGGQQPGRRPARGGQPAQGGQAPEGTPRPAEGQQPAGGQAPSGGRAPARGQTPTEGGGQPAGGGTPTEGATPSEGGTQPRPQSGGGGTRPPGGRRRRASQQPDDEGEGRGRRRRRRRRQPEEGPTDDEIREAEEETTQALIEWKDVSPDEAGAELRAALEFLKAMARELLLRIRAKVARDGIASFENPDADQEAADLLRRSKYVRMWIEAVSRAIRDGTGLRLSDAEVAELKAFLDERFPDDDPINRFVGANREVFSPLWAIVMTTSIPDTESFNWEAASRVGIDIHGRRSGRPAVPEDMELDFDPGEFFATHLDRFEAIREAAVSGNLEALVNRLLDGEYSLEHITEYVVRTLERMLERRARQQGEEEAPEELQAVFDEIRALEDEVANRREEALLQALLQLIGEGNDPRPEPQARTRQSSDLAQAIRQVIRNIDAKRRLIRQLQADVVVLRTERDVRWLWENDPEFRQRCRAAGLDLRDLLRAQRDADILRRVLSNRQQALRGAELSQEPRRREGLPEIPEGGIGDDPELQYVDNLLREAGYPGGLEQALAEQDRARLATAKRRVKAQILKWRQILTQPHVDPEVLRRMLYPQGNLPDDPELNQLRDELRRLRAIARTMLENSRTREWMANFRALLRANMFTAIGNRLVDMMSTSVRAMDFVLGSPLDALLERLLRRMVRRRPGQPVPTVNSTDLADLLDTMPAALQAVLHDLRKSAAPFYREMFYRILTGGKRRNPVESMSETERILRAYTEIFGATGMTHFALKFRANSLPNRVFTAFDALTGAIAGTVQFTDLIFNAIVRQYAFRRLITWYANTVRFPNANQTADRERWIQEQLAGDPYSARTEPEVFALHEIASAIALQTSFMQPTDPVEEMYIPARDSQPRARRRLEREARQAGLFLFDVFITPFLRMLTRLVGWTTDFHPVISPLKTIFWLLLRKFTRVGGDPITAQEWATISRRTRYWLIGFAIMELAKHIAQLDEEDKDDPDIPLDARSLLSGKWDPNGERFVFRPLPILKDIPVIGPSISLGALGGPFAYYEYAYAAERMRLAREKAKNGIAVIGGKPYKAEALAPMAGRLWLSTFIGNLVMTPLLDRAGTYLSALMGRGSPSTEIGKVLGRMLSPGVVRQELMRGDTARGIYTRKPQGFSEGFRMYWPSTRGQIPFNGAGRVFGADEETQLEFMKVAYDPKEETGRVLTDKERELLKRVGAPALKSLVQSETWRSAPAYEYADGSLKEDTQALTRRNLAKKAVSGIRSTVAACADLDLPEQVASIFANKGVFLPRIDWNSIAPNRRDEAKALLREHVARLARVLSETDLDRTYLPSDPLSATGRMLNWIDRRYSDVSERPIRALRTAEATFSAAMLYSIARGGKVDDRKLELMKRRMEIYRALERRLQRVGP